LSPRIMVNGDPAHLNNPENANRIRALLLAGIRAAMLWRQSGGGRLTAAAATQSPTAGNSRLLAGIA
jgi:high frequency lysogenization protein